MRRRSGKVMQTLNHIYQPKYTQGHQVSGILYLYDKSNTSRRNSASNSVRLFFGFSIDASGLSPNWLGIDNVSIVSRQ